MDLKAVQDTPTEIAVTPPNGSNQILKPSKEPSAKSKDKGREDQQIKSKEKPGDGKPTGAELKKLFKEEKAAKRAREKQHQQGQASAQGGKRTETAYDISKKVSVPLESGTTATKHQHKRAGSTNNAFQKPLAIRSAESSVTSTGQEQRQENKKVALFSHLYGNPRRTTLVGAGKDVHPAVLALGLQMSSYVICGSNARCVATLLVFKRVSVDLETNVFTYLIMS